MRCGSADWPSLKLKLPLASVLVRPTSSMPCPNLINTTSSPAAGLFVVPLFTVPVRFCAETTALKMSTRTSTEIFEESIKLSLLFSDQVVKREEGESVRVAPSPPIWQRLLPPRNFSSSGNQRRGIYPPCIRSSNRANSRTPPLYVPEDT